jgi:hypothetical protein
MSRHAGVRVGVLLLAVPAAVGAQESPRERRLFFRAGAAAVTGTATSDIRPGLQVATGARVAAQVSLLAQLVHHATDFSPRQPRFRPDRTFLLAGVEWSPRAAALEAPGDLDGAVRLNGGVAFREFLDPGIVAGLGLSPRVALAPFLVAILDVQGLLTWSPDDPFPRCRDNTYDPDCHPLAVSGANRFDGWAALLLELRW